MYNAQHIISTVWHFNILSKTTVICIPGNVIKKNQLVKLEMMQHVVSIKILWNQIWNFIWITARRRRSELQYMSCRQPFLQFQLLYVWLFWGFPPAHYHPGSFPKLRTDGIRGRLPMSSEWSWSHSAPSSGQTNQIKKSRSIFNFANPHKHQTLHTDINTIFDSPQYSRCGLN